MYKNDLKIAKSYISKESSCVHRGIKFELTFAQYKKLYNKLKCSYTGVSLVHGSTWSIDRLDNNEGYTFRNSVVCNKDLNGRKGNLTINDMLKIIRVWEKRKLLKS